MALGNFSCAVCILTAWPTQKHGTSFIGFIAPPLHSLGSHKDVISTPSLPREKASWNYPHIFCFFFPEFGTPVLLLKGSLVLHLPQILQVQLFRSLHREAESLNLVWFLLGFSLGSLQPCIACCNLLLINTVLMDTPIKEAAVPNFLPHEIASSLCQEPPFYNALPDLPLAQVWLDKPDHGYLSLSHFARTISPCNWP